jgi:hypothetical protein
MRVNEVIVTIDGKGKTFKSAKDSGNPLRAVEEAREWLGDQHKDLRRQLDADRVEEEKAQALLREQERDKPTKQRGKAQAVRPEPVVIETQTGQEG